MTYEVQLRALASDASMWDDTSQVLMQASTSAWSQSLGEYELSWAASVVGLTDTYSSIQAKVALLASEGSTQTTAIADTLRAVKHDYEVNEDRAVVTYRGAWEPIG